MDAHPMKKRKIDHPHRRGSWEIENLKAITEATGLPDEVCDQEKRAFQKGTNFKDYIEDTILNDTEINFRNRKKLFHCIGDNFERIFGFKHKGMRDTLSGTESGFTQWI